MPRVFLPQILWHSKDNKRCDRVYSIDFQPSPRDETNNISKLRRITNLKLATGGADEFVHIWQISIHDNAPQYTHSVKDSDFEQPLSIKILARLTGHIGEVNCVRWAHSGKILATGGEDRCIFLWVRGEKAENSGFNEETGQDYEEYWKRTHYFRLSNVVNSITWCPDDRLLAVSTEDGHISLVDIHVEGTGKVRYFDGHTNIAQGVALDPKNEVLASMGSDQCLRIWKRRNQRSWKSILVLKAARERGDRIEDTEENQLEIKRHGRCVFMSEELRTFFRRLDWSPDGRLLVVPSGIRHNTQLSSELPTDEVPISDTLQNYQPVYTLYIFYRKLINYGIPMITHQSPTGPFVVVKFSPIYLTMMDKKIALFNKLFQASKNNKLKPLKRRPTERTQNEIIANKIHSYFGQTNTATHEVASVTEEDPYNAETPQDNFHINDDETPKETSCPADTLSINPTGVLLGNSAVSDTVEMAIEVKEPPAGQENATTPRDLCLENERIEDAGSSSDDESKEEALNTGGYNLRKRSTEKPKFFDNSVQEKRPSKPRVKKVKEESKEEEYDTDTEEGTIPRFIFAAGTLDGSLCFYDTAENNGPIAVLKNLHFCGITDIAWSPDGYVCASSSSDGYITFVIFNRRELS